MFKFLVFVGFIFFLIYWFLVLPFKSTVEEIRQKPNPKRKAPGSDLNIDYIPKHPNKSSPARKDDGDYIDYEEVK